MCIVNVTYQLQGIVPSAPLWKELQASSTGAGDKQPTYLSTVTDHYNGPYEQAQGLTTYVVTITGKDIPDHLDVALVSPANRKSISGNSAFFSPMNFKQIEFNVTSQGKSAFHIKGRSPYSFAGNNVATIAQYNALSISAKRKYLEFWNDTIGFGLRKRSGDYLLSCDSFIYDPTVWMQGNAIQCFSTYTTVDTDSTTRSPVYTAPFTYKAELNADAPSAMGIFIFGESNGFFVISPSGESFDTRFGEGSTSSTVVDMLTEGN